MKIKRSLRDINLSTTQSALANPQSPEIEIELTAEELRDAFYMQQHIFDRDDMQYYLDECAYDWLRDSGYSEEFVRKFSVYLDELGYELRRQIDKYDISWEYARGEAVNEVLKRIATTRIAET